MRRIAGLLVACGMAVAAAPTAEAGERLVVAFESGVDGTQRALARERAEVDVRRALLGARRLQLVEVRDGGARAALRQLRRDATVAWAERDVRLHVASGDPRRAEQWGLARVRAPEAWALGPGEGVPIAVIDTGLAAGHDDLGPGLWTNPGESGAGQAANGVDDDDNGFVDDVHGWDFVDGDPVAEETNGHGTHVAGIAAARANNGAGVAGVTPAGAVMPVRAFWIHEGVGVAWGFELAMAISYAARNGARVINLSASGPYSRAIDETIRLHPEALIVTAAGNEGEDLAEVESYPCELPYERVVCVGATDRDDSLAAFSNYGPGVDIAAPGVDILSTVPARATVFADDFETGLSRWASQRGFATTTAQAADGSHSAAAGFTPPHPLGQSAYLRSPEVDLRGRYSCRLDVTTWFAGDHYPDGFSMSARALRVAAFGLLEYLAPDRVEARRHLLPIPRVDDKPEFVLDAVVWTENEDVPVSAAIDALRVDCADPQLPPGQSAELMTGTSMATPFVAGAAALIWGRSPAAGPGEVGDALLSSCDPVEALQGSVGCDGRLDVEAAARVDLAHGAPPAPPEPDPPLDDLPPAEGGAPGDLDPAFGNGRVVTIDGGQSPGLQPLAIFPEAGGGATVVSHEGEWRWVLTRVLDDGRPDEAFAGDGRVDVAVPPSPTSNAQYTRAAYRDDAGRIVLAMLRGYTNGSADVVVQRLLHDGAADASFGTGGHVVVRLPHRPDRVGLAPAPGGAIVLAASDLSHVRVFRLLPDGSPDPGFGDGGLARIRPAIDDGTFFDAQDVAVDRVGRILVAGRARHRGELQVGLFRLSSAGALDTSFGDAGSDWTGISPYGLAWLAISPDDRVVLAMGAFASSSKPPEIVVARRLPDGGPDPRFGRDGSAVFDTEPGEAQWAGDVAVLTDGSILAPANWVRSSGQWGTALMRLTRNGALDRGWRGGGVAELGIDGDNHRVHGLAVDMRGRTWTAGISMRDMAFARLLGGRATGGDGGGGDDDGGPGGGDPDGDDPGGGDVADPDPGQTDGGGGPIETAPGPSTHAPGGSPLPAAPATGRGVDGRSVPRRTTPARVSVRWLRTARGMRLRRLLIRGARAGSRYEIRCRGRGCPFGRKRGRLVLGRVNLTRLFANRPLAPATVVEIRVTRRGEVGRVTRIRIGTGKPRVTELCLPPGGPPRRCG